MEKEEIGGIGRTGQMKSQPTGDSASKKQYCKIGS